MLSGPILDVVLANISNSSVFLLLRATSHTLCDSITRDLTCDRCDGTTWCEHTVADHPVARFIAERTPSCPLAIYNALVALKLSQHVDNPRERVRKINYEPTLVDLKMAAFVETPPSRGMMAWMRRLSPITRDMAYDSTIQIVVWRTRCMVKVEYRYDHQVLYITAISCTDVERALSHANLIASLLYERPMALTCISN